MQVGMIGLGRMGGNMAERLRRGGHDVLLLGLEGFDGLLQDHAELVLALHGRQAEPDTLRQVRRTRP